MWDAVAAVGIIILILIALFGYACCVIAGIADRQIKQFMKDQDEPN